MDVIPVIDVQYGVAVHARRGQRAGYRPLVSPLAGGSDPVEVARGLRGLFAFPVLYVADLDGIEGRGPNERLIERLTAALPGVGLWLDAGTPVREVLACIRRGGSILTVTPVVGTEGIAGAADVAALRALPTDRYVLSLDFRGDRFEGPPEVLAEPEHWPWRVVVMSLARVGSGEGPDLARISEVVAMAGGRSVYAAGGARHAADMEAARRAGAAGILIASALHAGAITAGDLEAIAGR